MFGLQGFLREHYTASKETAAAIAAYLIAVDREAPPPTRASKRSGKPKDKAKDQSKDKTKPGEAKSAKPAKDKGEAKRRRAPNPPSPNPPSPKPPSPSRPSRPKPRLADSRSQAGRACRA